MINAGELIKAPGGCREHPQTLRHNETHAETHWLFARMSEHTHVEDMQIHIQTWVTDTCLMRYAVVLRLALWVIVIQSRKHSGAAEARDALLSKHNTSANASL